MTKIGLKRQQEMVRKWSIAKLSVKLSVLYMFTIFCAYIKTGGFFSPLFGSPLHIMTNSWMLHPQNLLPLFFFSLHYIGEKKKGLKLINVSLQ